MTEGESSRTSVDRAARGRERATCEPHDLHRGLPIMTAQSSDTPEPRTLSRAEFDALLERHLPLLRSYVRLRAGARLRAREPIGDLVQSTLRELCEERTDFVYTSDAGFRRYLCTVATHKILSKNRYWEAGRRDVERQESALLDEVRQVGDSSLVRSPSRAAEHEEDLERLREAFDELNEVDRQILALRRIFDVPVSEIAAEVGLAESTVRWRLGVILSEIASKLSKGT